MKQYPYMKKLTKQFCYDFQKCSQELIQKWMPMSGPTNSGNGIIVKQTENSDSFQEFTPNLFLHFENDLSRHIYT